MLFFLFLDLGDIDNVFAEFDAIIKPKTTRDNLLAVRDASSLLWRLNVMGIDPGEKRWGVVTDAVKSLIHNHRSPW